MAYLCMEPTAIDLLVAELRAYAKQRVDERRQVILANLRTKDRGEPGPLVLDVALPSAGFFSIAAGGMAEVLHLLGEEVVQVDRFIGASTGACSLFLIVANGFREVPGPQGPSSRAPMALPKAKSEPRGNLLQCLSEREWQPPDTQSKACLGRGEGRRCPNSSLLLRSYLEYGDSEGGGVFVRGLNSVKQGFVGKSEFWEKKYREVLRDDAAFTAIRERTFVAACAAPVRSLWPRRTALFGSSPQEWWAYTNLSTKAKDIALSQKSSNSHVISTVPCHPLAQRQPRHFEATSDNYIFHDFANREQAVQAFCASGEATLKGFANGISILEASEYKEALEKKVEFRLLDETGTKCSAPLKIPDHYCDGGGPVLFRHLPSGSPPSRAGGSADKSRHALLYYHTFFDTSQDSFIVTSGSVERLFKKAVDRTIACLCSKDLVSTETPCCTTWALGSTDKMVIVLPHESPLVELGKIGVEKSLGQKEGTFVDLQTGDMFEV